MIEVERCLNQIESELRRLNMWDNKAILQTALRSTKPFCIDTMTFVQWLQFVFIPTLRDMMASGKPLPDTCGIAPMAHEYFRGLPAKSHTLVSYLDKIDKLLDKS